jgi:hypothetical protein
MPRLFSRGRVAAGSQPAPARLPSAPPLPRPYPLGRWGDGAKNCAPDPPIAPSPYRRTPLRYSAPWLPPLHHRRELGKHRRGGNHAGMERTTLSIPGELLNRLRLIAAAKQDHLAATPLPV